MSENLKKRVLRNLKTSEISPNPENPRLVFRQEEMESLMLSIDKHGVQVPITVYRDSHGYTLLDGERRWRCARKLNLKQIPALVQEKPTELQNLVLMYNIHSLREQWDYFTIASKLERVMALYEAEEKQPANEIILSELTGLSRGAIRRCRLLLDLPDRFKVMIQEELERPKALQKLSEDFFIEMEKSLKTVTTRLPEYENDVEMIRDTLISKFRDGTISAVTDFRKLSKIATAVEGLGIAETEARKALNKIFDPVKKISIRDAYSEAVEFEYIEKKATQNARSLIEFAIAIEQDHRNDNLDSSLVEELRKLHDVIGKILGIET